MNEERLLLHPLLQIEKNNIPAMIYETQIKLKERLLRIYDDFQK